MTRDEDRVEGEGTARDEHLPRVSDLAGTPQPETPESRGAQLLGAVRVDPSDLLRAERVRRDAAATAIAAAAAMAATRDAGRDASRASSASTRTRQPSARAARRREQLEARRAEAELARRGTTARQRAGRTSARAAAGVIALAVIAGTALIAQSTELPSQVVSPVTDRVAPEAGTLTRACAGPFVDARGEALSPTGSSPVTAGGSSAVERQPLATPIMGGAGASANGAAPAPAPAPAPVDPGAPAAPVAIPDSTPVALRVDATKSAAAFIAGSQTQSVITSNGRGLTASACAPAVQSQWLVGGSTETGRSASIMLVNPNPVEARVNLSLFGEAGALQAVGAADVFVPANGSTVMNLNGLAPDVKQLATRVTTSKGTVAAYLQTTVQRGLQPGGVEVTGTTASPAATSTVAGVLLTTAVGDPDPTVQRSDLDSAVRIVSDAGAPTTAHVEVLRADGSTAHASEVTVGAHATAELPLQALPTGVYSVRVTAETPVTAAVRVNENNGQGTDYTWYTASRVLSGDQSFTVAPGPAPRIHIANTAPTPMTATLRAAGGASQPIELAPGQTATLDATQGATYTLTGIAQGAITVTYQGENQLASFTVPPGDTSTGDIVLYQ